jgi:hypothetical protein
MTESERVTIPYLTVAQVVDMAGFKSRGPVYAACDSGEIKVLNKKPKDAKKYERHLDPQSVHFWLGELKIREERAAAEQKAKEEKAAARAEQKNGKQLKLKLRGSKDEETQLDRIERKIDQLMKDWS